MSVQHTESNAVNMRFEIVPFRNQCGDIRVLKVVHFVRNDFNVKLDIFRIGRLGNNGGGDVVVDAESIEFVVFHTAEHRARCNVADRGRG